jgi:hypothetical protein
MQRQRKLGYYYSFVIDIHIKLAEKTSNSGLNAFGVEKVKYCRIWLACRQTSK